MEIFTRLVFGHLLADFTFQTNFIADWKRRSSLGLLAHVAIHPTCYIVLTWPFLNDTWCTFGSVSLNGWVCVLIATLLHFVEDWFRIARINNGWKDGTLFYAWDQAIHLVVLWFLCPRQSQPLQSVWPALGILFVIVTHFATVTVWFIEKDIYGRDYPETQEKYISILQRLVVWLSFFLPSPWWMLMLAFILVSFGRHVWTRKIDFSWSSILMGNTLAIACGVMSRKLLGYSIF